MVTTQSTRFVCKSDYMNVISVYVLAVKVFLYFISTIAGDNNSFQWEHATKALVLETVTARQLYQHSHAVKNT